MRQWIGHPSDDRYVSILVFVEVALGRPELALDIQEHTSFNPCFRGSRPRTLRGGVCDPTSSQFQSLFSWKSPSDSMHEGKDKMAYTFQSLFSWKSPSDPAARSQSYGPSGFQSLFSWKSPSDPAHCGDAGSGDQSVSILVFVEVALGHWFALG